MNSPDETPSLVSTAHDVLEDWAILQWLGEQHLTAEGSFEALSAAIGAHPAVRRSYRRWIAELIERDTAAADRLFQAAMTEAKISVQFRDDTLVSLLRAPLAPDFLPRHEVQLLANDRSILKRVIHLLRVACVKTPEWLSRATERGSILNVPDGSAWPTVLMLVHRNLASFTSHDTRLLLGLVEDAVRGVSWWAPDIEGAEFVAGIAHWILNGLREYGVEELRKRVLKVIAKIPKADATRFEAVLRGHVKPGERRDYVAEELRKMIYLDTEGMSAARDLPDLVISVGANYLLASDADLRGEQIYSRSSLELELYFGLKNELHFDSFPASAIRGPWIHLLRYHPRKALDFINKVVSHCSDWYAHPRLHDPLETPWEVELTFADGTSKRQWASGRLWGLYRGLGGGGPRVLESLLMALETFLLDLGKEVPSELDALLVDILRRADSAAIAAVVASVAIAHPRAAGEALLVLLSARDYIEIDRNRLEGEREMSAFSGMMPTLRSDHQSYEAERKHANGLPHRGTALEKAIRNLQFGPLASRIWAILDRHLSVLPSIEGQSEQDRMWRLAIHQMDLRQYAVSEHPGPDIREGEAGEQPRHFVRLDPKPPDADLQPIVDDARANLAAMGARFGVLVWGLKALDRKDGEYDPSQWAARLCEARALDPETDYQDGSRHGPGVVAAVCVRDHWDEMSGDQRKWCLDLVCAEVLRQADDPDHGQRYSMAADRSCASVLMSLLRKDLPAAEDMLRVRSTFATAITHSIDEVRWCATHSIDETVWANDRALVLQCIGAIAREAALLDSAQVAMERRRQPFKKGQDFGETLAKITASVRAGFWKERPITGDVLSTVNASQRFGARAAVRILTILSCVPKDPVAIAAFVRASAILVGLWQSKDDGGHRQRRDYETEAAISGCLEGFLLRTSREAARDVLGPLLGIVDLHTRELQSIVQGLTSLQDRSPHTPQYWFLWEMFAVAVKQANWVAHLGDDRADGSDLLSAIFLTAYWKDGVRHWETLEGYAHLVHALFEALPPTSIVLEDYALFLYHIGEQSLPDAFVRISDALRRGDAQEMLKTTNTVFVLEVKWTPEMGPGAKV